MTFEEMFQSAKEALQKAVVADENAAVAVQVNVTGDGAGIFYIKASNGVLEVEPYDYIDNDAVLTADSAALLTALTKADTASLTFEGNEEKIAAMRTILATLPAPKRTRRTTKTTAAKTTTKTAAAKKETAAKTTTAKTTTAKTTATKTTTRKTTAAKKAAAATETAAAETAAETTTTTRSRKK